jgi:hypothetical protein
VEGEPVSFQLLAAPEPQPGRADLDRVEAEAGQFVAGGWVARTVPGLVAEVKRLRAEVEEWKMTAMAGAEVLADRDAELRAAREAIEAGRAFLVALADPEPLRHWTEGRYQRLAEKLAAYDRAVSGP